MKSILYLVHRIPYPPNKGDKIRSFNILRYLSKNYNVYLGAFIDTEDDYEYIKNLEKYTAEYKIVKINKKIQTILSFKGFATGKPLTLPYFYNSTMKSWVAKTIDSVDISNIIVFSSPMAQYVTSTRFANINKIMDFVDVDSEKWSEYAKKKSWPVSGVYQREADYLFDYEKKVVEQFDKCLFVSREESNLFLNKLDSQTLTRKIDYFNNGVDTGYFNKELMFEDPFVANSRRIVFTGAMDYWANIDAVKWFVEHVFIDMHKQYTDITFHIVGSNPSKEVVALDAYDGVNVVGKVDDIRPYIKHADLIVAPMRIARGIQNKVLEALALAKPVVLTSAAAEGINARNDEHFYICDTEKKYQMKCLEILDNPKSAAVTRIADNAEELIQQNYSWRKQLERFGSMLV